MTIAVFDWTNAATVLALKFKWTTGTAVVAIVDYNSVDDIVVVGGGGFVTQMSRNQRKYKQ